MKACYFVIALQWTICTLLEIIIFWYKKYFIIEKLMIYQMRGTPPEKQVLVQIPQPHWDFVSYTLEKTHSNNRK